jgi:hypothetical protein
VGVTVQDQAGLTGPTIALEQQADCFAGAWVRHLADGESGSLSLNEGNLDTGLAGYLTLRDTPGSDPAADDAHGSAFDRVGAFQEGYDGGVPRCAFRHRPAAAHPTSRSAARPGGRPVATRRCAARGSRRRRRPRPVLGLVARA